ncbi:MAG: hypothetical protein M3198_20255 [Actinomycetota bacterium]|nr:hypothetical protein [Actinomycetota bacterium]
MANLEWQPLFVGERRAFYVVQRHAGISLKLATLAVVAFVITAPAAALAVRIPVVSGLLGPTRSQSAANTAR